MNGHTRDPGEPTKPSVLFLAPAMLERRVGDPIRGVQLFDLNLIRQLVGLGHRVCVMAERSWRSRLQEHLGHLAQRSARERGGLFIWTPNLLKPFQNGVWGTLAARLAGKRFDRLIVGNASSGIAPVVDLVYRTGVVPRAHTGASTGVVIPHKIASDRFVRTMRRHELGVCAINQQIGAQYGCKTDDAPNQQRADWPAPVHVRYGVANADLFSPADDWPDRLNRACTPDKPMRLIVLGKLDNPWKGADEAIASVRALPEHERARIELHLASYSPSYAGQTDFSEAPSGARIEAHPWMSPEAVAELLRTMDVMLVPSRSEHETFSQAIVQGMLTGLPIIATDLDVLIEKLDTHTDAPAGIVVPRVRSSGDEARADIKELAQTIVQLNNAPDVRSAMGQAARRIALERYVWDTRWFSETFLV